LLDLLAIKLDERDFNSLKPPMRIRAGLTLPPPGPVFPRYVEAEDKN
jgi:methionyl-tRNA synthetase